jgi:glutathione S-transferase
MFFEQYDLEINIAVVRFWLHYSGLPESAYADQLEAKMAGGYKSLAAMEKHLGDGREWFVGDSPTIADLALYGYAHVAHEGGFEMGPYPMIRAWIDRVAAMPAHVAIDA